MLMSIKNTVYRIIPAKPDDAIDICYVLIRSIIYVCGPDYLNDEEIIDEWLKNKTPENIEQWISSPNNFSYKAIDNEKNIVGFTLMNRAGEILLNYVGPGYLHRGIGKLFLQKFEEVAKFNNISEMSVDSTITARNFYLRNGFSLCGEPKMIGNIVGEFPMKKILVG